MAQLKYMLYAHYGSVVLTDEKVFDTDDQALWEDVRSSAEFHYDGDDFALEIAQKLGIKKIPVWTWLHRHKNDLEQVKQLQRANPPGPWPTYDDRSERALRRRGVTLSQANTDQIDHAIQQLERLA